MISMMRLVGGIKISEVSKVVWVMAVVLFAAVTSSPVAALVEGSQVETASAVQTWEALRVETAASGTFLFLEGLEAPGFVLEESAEGDLFKIELPGVRRSVRDSAEEEGVLSLYDGLVDQITTSTFEGPAGPTTRIEVSLSAPASLEEGSFEGVFGFIVRPLAILPIADLSPKSDSVSPGDPTEDQAIESVLLEEAEDPWAVAETIAGLNEMGSQAVATGTDFGAPAAVPAEAEVNDRLEAVTTEAIVESVPAEEGTQASLVTHEAKKLTGIQVRPTQEGVLLFLEADGWLNNAQAFAIENPDRLVIDLFGVEIDVQQNPIPVGHAQVDQIRWGAHTDKLRVVVDGGPDVSGFQGRRVVPVPDGLILTVGQGTELEEALQIAQSTASPSSPPLRESVAVRKANSSIPAVGIVTATAPVEHVKTAHEIAGVEPEGFSAPAALEAPVSMPPTDSISPLASSPVPAASAPAEIFGLQYDRDAIRDRIAVLADAPVEYEIFEPDAETVVLQIANAVVSAGAGDKVTPEPGGPVSMVSVFQQPEVAEAQVRVVVRRAPDLAPRVTRRGSLLLLDFAREGLVAEPPPAFPSDESSLEESMDPSLKASLKTELPRQTADSIGQTQPVGEKNRELAKAAALDASGSAPAALADVVSALDSSLPERPSPRSVPQAVPASLEGPASVDLLEEGGLITGKEYTGRRISLDFKDVLVADVLRLIAEVSDLNIVAGDEVKGTVTIRLVDVPWDQALDVILLTKGLGFVRVGNVLRIAPSEVLKVEEEVRLQERRNKEKLEDLEVRLQPVNYASVVDVAQLVKRLLSPRGTVNTDVRTNTVIIKDIPSVINEATALVKAIDTQTPQVLIEAKIVEANLDFGRELGSVWDIGTQRFTDGFNPTTPRTDLGGRDFKFQDVNNVSVGNPITSVPTGAINFGAFLLDDKMEVNVHIEAMERSGDGKVISSPRVVTLDNREAIIEQGVSIPFQTFEGGDAKLEFIDAVLSLKVTPHITADESIIMNLEVTRNAPDSSVPTPTGSPAIAKNQAKTETLIKDGQTLVIGGIYTIEKTTRESRVPYLHKIPLIGAAFKSREISDSRKELLIFVTPRVVVNPALASAN